jgi:hypothetical protein
MGRFAALSSAQHLIERHLLPAPRKFARERAKRNSCLFRKIRMRDIGFGTSQTNAAMS